MKKNNKGFSLVELIIVIAIMAILAGAIAPALIRYIDKSRKSNDVTAAKTIKTAVETAMANEKTYEGLTKPQTGSEVFINITPGGSTSAAVAFANHTIESTHVAKAQEEIFKNIGETVPRVKYKKKADGTHEPKVWVVSCSTGGTISVYLSGAVSTKDYQLCPEICDYYQ